MINVLVLANGQQIGSGKSGEPSIQSCTVTQAVNSGRELTPGSVCSACLEAKIITTDRRLSIPVGEGNSVILMREDGTQVGVFVPEQPVQLTANTYKLVAYDNVSRLDRDLSDWLKALDGWPYTLKTFAQMVAGACGVELVVEEIPNGSFNVQKFYQAGVTGRQILQWVGEMACRFLYADPEGKLRFGWYEDRGGQITPSGDGYYFAGALKYEDYKVAAVDAVKVRLSGTDGGLLWPDGAAENPYVVAGNPIVLAKVDGSLPSHLGAILRELLALPEYRPCKVSVPADRDIRVGDIVTVQDIYGVRFQTLVMTRTVTGQRQTLECTGSMVRGSSTAANSKTPGQIAQEAVDRQSQKDIFNKLTDRGKAQGLFLGEDGNVYVNASWIAAGVLASKDDGKTFYLDLTNGILKMQATELMIGGKSVEDIAGDAASGAVNMTAEEMFNKLTDNGRIQGIQMVDGKFYVNAEVINAGTLLGMLLKAGKIQSKNGKIVIDLDSEKEPVFNSGISVNGLRVRGDAAGSSKSFTVETEKHNNAYSTVVSAYSATGERLLSFQENFTGSGDSSAPYGCDFRIRNRDASQCVEFLLTGSQCDMILYGSSQNSGPQLRAFRNDSSAGLYFMMDGSVKGMLCIDSNGIGLQLPGRDTKYVYWAGSDDGAYTLAGK